MFNQDDAVSHKMSGCVGKVVAYGHQIVDGTYQPTLRVRITDSLTTSQTMFVEDVVSLWERVEQNLNRTFK